MSIVQSELQPTDEERNSKKRRSGRRSSLDDLKVSHCLRFPSLPASRTMGVSRCADRQFVIEAVIAVSIYFQVPFNYGPHPTALLVSHGV